jgi:GNAT superfamily N-acetyltransferase
MYKLDHGGACYGIIDAVAVLPHYQGQGIGTALMHHALAKCREYECYKITLSSNQARYQAHAFYEKLGLQRHGHSFVLPLNQ